VRVRSGAERGSAVSGGSLGFLLGKAVMSVVASWL
jgi:hypothetical protein